MHYENRYPGIDRYAVWMVKRKALQLTRQSGFSPADRKDLEQELMLHLVLNLPRHNPERGTLSTFIDRVIESKAATLIAANTAPVRDRRRCMSSLDEPMENGDTELGKLLHNAEESIRQTWICEASCTAEQAQATRLDVHRVIEHLSAQQQLICKALMSGTPSQVIRELKIPRKRFYREMKLLRAIFAQAGLRDYV